MKELERAVLADDALRVHAAFLRLGMLTPDTAPAPDELLDWYRMSYEPVLAPQPAAYTPEFAAAAVRRHFDPLGPYGRLVRSISLPRDFVFLNRIFVGLNSVLAGLHATADWRALADEVREAGP